ncbi:MAG: peptidoglycan-binding domain-containing protein [Bacteroidetes bacterium]|nr:peptidoglycan-binding domain-containing protein [Bacteroidota bacterium]
MNWQSDFVKEMSTKIYTIPAFGDKGIHVETLQSLLQSMGYNTGGIDGDFGKKTRNAIREFQQQQGIPDTGMLDAATLSALQLVLETGYAADPKLALTTIVDRSGICRTVWSNRGGAPHGFYYGMVLSYANFYRRLKANDKVVKEMVKALVADEKKDALYKYRDVLENNGMNASAPRDMLRKLFVLMFGLAIMESTGRHCCGWDRGKLTGWGDSDEIVTPKPENSEAGLFQISYDILYPASTPFKNLLSSIYTSYKQNPDGYIGFFSKGAVCKPEDADNFGSGEGELFQQFSKQCPAFTVELAAVALRYDCNHWGPIRQKGNTEKGVEIKKEMEVLLRSVESYLDANNPNTP